MLIKSLWAENFKSFGARTEIPLSQITLFIGPNNAGKSNILEIPRLLKEFEIVRPDPPIRLVGERSQLIRSGTDRMSVGLVASEADAEVKLSATIDKVGHGGSELTTSKGWRAAADIRMPLHIQDKTARQLMDRLPGYDIWHLRPEVIGQPSGVAPQTTVGRHGEGAAAVLDHLRDLDPTKYDALQTNLRRCVPELDRVVAMAMSGNQKEIVFVEKSGVRLPSRQVSEGLRFLLFFLLVLHGPAVPRTMAFEDIEHGLHPRRIKDVLGFMRELTRGPGAPQVLLTTHSPLVLDEFRDSPEEVVVVERGTQGTTTCTRLPDRMAKLPNGSDDVALGDLWYSGVLGGVPGR